MGSRKTWAFTGWGQVVSTEEAEAMPQGEFSVSRTCTATNETARTMVVTSTNGRIAILAFPDEERARAMPMYFFDASWPRS